MPSLGQKKKRGMRGRTLELFFFFLPNQRGCNTLSFFSLLLFLHVFVFFSNGWNEVSVICIIVVPWTFFPLSFFLHQFFFVYIVLCLFLFLNY